MNTIFEICVFIVLVGIPCQLFYWCVVRPVLLAKAEFDVCRLRVKLLELAAHTTREGKLAVPIIDKRCENFLRWKDAANLILPFW